VVSRQIVRSCLVTLVHFGFPGSRLPVNVIVFSVEHTSVPTASIWQVVRFDPPPLSTALSSVQEPGREHEHGNAKEKGSHVDSSMGLFDSTLCRRPGGASSRVRGRDFTRLAARELSLGSQQRPFHVPPSSCLPHAPLC
jgi:hypothetical protein